MSSAAFIPAPAKAKPAERARALRPAPRAVGLPAYLQRAALNVAAPDSPLEEEAEEVAAQVMRLPEGAGTASAASGERPRQQGGAAAVQRAAAGATPAAPAWLARPGQGMPLDADVRSRVEPALGVGLGHVRVHTDAEAQAKASVLEAKAFTHGSHIWLGRGQSPRDVGLIAHELTHVAQQGAGGDDTALVQRRPADYRHPEDGENVRRRLEGRIAAEVDDPPSNVSPAEARRRMGRVDRGKLAGKKADVGPDARPDVDRPAEARPGIEKAADATQEEADKPPEPMTGEEGKKPEEKEKKEPEAPGAAAEAAASAAAEAAFALADAVTAPLPEPEVTVPDPVEPIDAAGQPLPGDPAADAAVTDLAGRGQTLRERGLLLRAQAAEIRANADLMRGNIRLVRGGIAQADASLTLAGDQLTFRRETVGQAGQALTLAKEKAAKVAAEAPGFKAQAEEGAAESGPMASEANEVAAENAAQAPDDAEAAEKANEQGGKIAQVQQGAATMDQAIRGTGAKATSLSADAERAKAVNEQTAARLTGVDETLASTGERLGQMRETTQAARERVEGLAGEPDALTASADELDRQGAGLVAASVELEQRLREVQSGYAADMRAVPAQEFVAEDEAPVVQRQPEEEGAAAAPPPAAAEAMAGPAPIALETAAEPAGAPGGAPASDRYEAREQLDLVSGLPTWLTGVEPETEARREQRKAEADRRRAEEIAQIEAWTGGEFDELSGLEKVGMALRLSGGRLWRKIAGIGWPDWRKAGKLLVSLLDPRSALAGVVSGLSMTLSGVLNLGQLSLTGIVEDPWGSLQNLLKSAADIATGITVVLGSITALAGAIAAIMTAITILSFGFAAPVTGPIIAFCTSVMVTVGGWTIVAGKIALLLQALVLIKNLVDAYCAESADQLQAQVDQIGADAGNMLNVGMQIVGAKMAQVGGRVTQNKIVQAGGGVRAAAQLGAGARSLAGRGVRGTAGFGRRLRQPGALRAIGGQLGRGTVAAVGWGGRAIASLPGRAWRGAGRLAIRGAEGVTRLPDRLVRGLLGAPQRVVSGVRSLPGRVREALVRQRRELREQFSREFIVGEDITTPRQAAQAAAERRASVLRDEALPVGPATARARPQGEPLARRQTLDGAHEIKVFADGTIARCSDHCARLRTFYGQELSHRTDLADELALWEEWARLGPREADEVAELAAAMEFRLQRLRYDAARERQAVLGVMRQTRHLPDRPLPEDLIWTNAPANVPIPTAYERAHVQAYLRALGDWQTARLRGRRETMAAASQRLDEIERLATNPTSAEGVFLGRHLDALQMERQRLQGQLTGTPPSGVPVASFARGELWEVELVFGTRIDDLPRLTNGRVAVPISGRLPPMRHRTLADLNSIMRGNPKVSSGTRVTWVLDDGSTVNLDIPGRGARLRSEEGRPFEISRQPHLSREFTSDFVVDPSGRRVSLHVSDEGVIVPAASSPAHIPVELTSAELRGLLRSLGRENEFAELVNFGAVNSL